MNIPIKKSKTPVKRLAKQYTCPYPKGYVLFALLFPTLFAIILVISVKKSINDCIESAINVENEKVIPDINFKNATTKFKNAVIIIILFSFIFSHLLCVLL